jgi:mono/diheme cytochrome c family protein
MPDMHFSPAMKVQEPDPWSPNGTSMRLPAEGTVPVHFRPYTISNLEADELASAIPNPLPRTAEVIATGQKYFNIFCIACHGENGNGLGSVVAVNAGMPMPPELFSEKATMEWTDGRIFHVLTVGQGNMPAYASKIDEDKRWAIVHYVRALQAAARPTDADVIEARARGALVEAQ